MTLIWKRAIFDLLSYFLVTREKTLKFLQHIPLNTYLRTFCSPYWLFLPSQFCKKFKFIMYGFSLVTRGPGGGTQLWVGYGCAAQSFEHYPITKPEKTQICYLYQNHSFSLRALFKTNQCFLQCKLGCISTFWQPVDKPKDKFIGNYAFCENATYIKTNFQIKKGPLQNLRARKSTLSGLHIPVPTFPLSTPPGLVVFIHFRAILE